MYIMTFCKLTDICNTTIVNYHTKQHVLQRYAIILMSKGLTFYFHWLFSCFFIQNVVLLFAQFV